MQVICFATPRAEESAAPLVAAFRTRVPVDAVVTVVAGDQDRALWRSEFAGCEVVPDKPAGGKFAFVRELRRRRFDLALVAWTGGDRFRPMRMVALLAGARRVLVLDERGRWFTARGLWPWAMCRHALRRLAGTKADACLRGLAAVYRWSVGLCLALPILAWRCRRLPPARPGPRA